MTLQPNTWLNDEIMNYVCKNIISPIRDDIIFFSSYFFTKLIGLRRDRYDYKEVKGYGLGTGNRATYRESNDIFKRKELYVPINKDNQHWLHLRVISSVLKFGIRWVIQETVMIASNTWLI